MKNLKLMMVMLFALVMTSVGFISFGINKHENPTCSCYGESVSLGLKSNPEEDTEIAKRQLNMIDDY